MREGIKLGVPLAPDAEGTRSQPHLPVGSSPSTCHGGAASTLDGICLRHCAGGRVTEIGQGSFPVGQGSFSPLKGCTSLLQEGTPEMQEKLMDDECQVHGLRNTRQYCTQHCRWRETAGSVAGGRNYSQNWRTKGVGAGKARLRERSGACS